MRRGMTSSWNVRRHPILSASEPPVNEPTVAPANVELTTHPKANREHVSEQQKIRQSQGRNLLWHNLSQRFQPDLILPFLRNRFSSPKSFGSLWRCATKYLEGWDLLQNQDLLQCIQVLHWPLCITKKILFIAEKGRQLQQSYGGASDQLRHKSRNKILLENWEEIWIWVAGFSLRQLWGTWREG